MALIGDSFQPGNNDDPNNSQFRDSGGPNGAVGPNIGQAIQILRIRMPHVFGLAPSPMMAGGPLSGFGRTIQNLMNTAGILRPNTIPQGGIFDPSGAPFRPASGPQPSPGFQYNAPPQTAPPVYAAPTPQVVAPPPSPLTPVGRPAPLPGFKPGRTTQA
jgi:hypothetical protein